MKTVIRKGVFETNSSSTHSLSLGMVSSKEIDEEASFEIRTREAKIALFFGLIENAEMEFCQFKHRKAEYDKKLVLSFKEAVIEEYCKLNNYTKEQALLQIDYEEFSNTYLRDILKNEKTAKEKLNEYLNVNEDFKTAFKQSKNNDIVEFAKGYLVDDYNEFKRITNGKFRCDKYFENGCLNNCDCGFESYTKIAEQFDLDGNKVEDKAKEFLSDESKIIAKEYWNGFIFEKTGEIF